VIVLETERMIFRPHEAGDLDAFCAMEMDTEVRRYVGGYPRTREEAEKRFPAKQLQAAADRLGVWAAVLKANGQYVGRCGLYSHLDADGRKLAGEAVLSFYIARDKWRRGLASEAAAAFVAFGWGELKLDRIVAMVEVGNAASIRILERLGFALTAKEEGGHRSFYHFSLPSPQAEVKQ
jgi:ribosomal-protein-alanine N-acetyltransferase